MVLVPSAFRNSENGFSASRFEQWAGREISVVVDMARSNSGLRGKNFIMVCVFAGPLIRNDHYLIQVRK